MIALLALVGLAVGSFLNVCIDRLPRGESLLSPPSHCDACGRRLALRDNVPLVSYLWIKGRCRYCGVRISPRLPLVELITAVTFAFLAQRYGLTLSLAIYWFYFSLFLVIFVIDLERGIIPNVLVYPAWFIALALSFFMPERGIVSTLVGGVTGLGVMLLPYLIYKQGMGAGDVKLGALIGLAVGFPQVFVALFLAMMGGGLVAGALLLLRLKGRKGAIPFGPFLSAGAMVTLLWGESIWQWYLKLLT